MRDPLAKYRWTHAVVRHYKYVMAGSVFYSTNPWFAVDVSVRYRGSTFFAWVCEYYDVDKAPAGSSSAMVAPSSNPRKIYEDLWSAVHREEEHSALIKGYKKKFRQLAGVWLSNREISMLERDEIVATVNTSSWKIWRPVLYVIPSGPVMTRLAPVPRTLRAGHGGEWRIGDLKPSEFDIIEVR